MGGAGRRNRERFRARSGCQEGTISPSPAFYDSPPQPVTESSRTPNVGHAFSIGGVCVRRQQPVELVRTDHGQLDKRRLAMIDEPLEPHLALYLGTKTTPQMMRNTAYTTMEIEGDDPTKLSRHPDPAVMEYYRDKEVLLPTKTTPGRRKNEPRAATQDMAQRLGGSWGRGSYLFPWGVGSVDGGGSRCGRLCW